MTMMVTMIKVVMVAMILVLTMMVTMTLVMVAMTLAMLIMVTMTLVMAMMVMTLVVAMMMAMTMIMAMMIGMNQKTSISHYSKNYSSLSRLTHVTRLKVAVNRADPTHLLRDTEFKSDEKSGIGHLKVLFRIRYKKTDTILVRCPFNMNCHLITCFMHLSF